jgi:3-oxoacyl-[acyl-carrier-protein] synthase-3
VKIAGTGSALPERVLTNLELEKMVDTADAWIFERTGIRERRIAGEKTATSDLVADAIIVGTSTPDTVYPATACWVQKRLGIRGMAAFDVSAGCSGFLFALELGANLVRTGRAKKVAVAGGEVMSKVVNWKDRNTCVLFGDGAGAAILVPGDDKSGPLASNWGCDGNLAPLLYQPAGGTRLPFSEQVLHDMSYTVHMDGNSVFKHAVHTMGDAAVKAMKDVGVTVEQVKIITPHKANLRIMEAVRARIGYPRELQYEVIHKYGNMSAATVPVCLDEAHRLGRIQAGDIIAMTAFGTGFTWAASVWRW